jgi:hypothetical protein
MMADQVTTNLAQAVCNCYVRSVVGHTQQREVLFLRQSRKRRTGQESVAKSQPQRHYGYTLWRLHP